jgi:outer membrane protein assembly factor BamB
VGDHVVVGSADDYVYALDARSGALEGSFKTTGPVLSSPAVVRAGVVVVGSNDGKLYAIKGIDTPRK